MPSPEHSDYRFSVTTHTDDLAVVGCLRALADFSQKIGNKRMPGEGRRMPTGGATATPSHSAGLSRAPGTMIRHHLSLARYSDLVCKG